MARTGAGRDRQVTRKLTGNDGVLEPPADTPAVVAGNRWPPASPAPRERQVRGGSLRIVSGAPDRDVKSRGRHPCSALIVRGLTVASSVTATEGTRQSTLVEVLRFLSYLPGQARPRRRDAVLVPASPAATLRVRDVRVQRTPPHIGQFGQDRCHAHDLSTSRRSMQPTTWDSGTLDSARPGRTSYQRCSDPRSSRSGV